MINILTPVILQLFNCKLLTCEKIGGGASGVVYKLTIDKPPFCLAVKTAKNSDLLKKECEYINYISALADIKFPKIYYCSTNESANYAIMEFFDGKNCSDKFLLKAPKKTRIAVAEQIADNIIKLQQVHGDKYGDLTNPIYNNWHDYYRPFVNMIVKESEILEKDGYINKTILKAIQLGERLYDSIFDEPISQPTAIHGDYWVQNIIIDNNFHLIGVVDPFNSMWADNEYELFALNAIYGKKLPVLESFLSKVEVSKKFFLKNSFYLLMSETFWVCKLHHDNKKYLMSITRKFHKQLKTFNL